MQLAVPAPTPRRSRRTRPSRPRSTTSGNGSAQNAANEPTGAEAALATYVTSQDHQYAGDCADATLPKDKGKWCSTLIEGDDTTDTKTYDVGPVGGKAVSNVTVTRKGRRSSHRVYQVGVADGNVGTPRQFTAAELAGNTFITGNLVLDQAAGIGNGLADLPAAGTPAGGTGGTDGTGATGRHRDHDPARHHDPGGGTARVPAERRDRRREPERHTGWRGVVPRQRLLAERDAHRALRRQVVGSLLSDSSGKFAGSLGVPDRHVAGLAPDHGEGLGVLDQTLTINVLGGLAFTGTSNHTSTVVLAGLAALMVGLVLVVGTRRRRTQGHSTGPPVT